MNTVDKTYEARVNALAEQFDALPRGARMAASHDLQLAPSVVSNVLNGKIVREDVLGGLEDWITSESAASVANRQSSRQRKLSLVSVFINNKLQNVPDAMTPVATLYQAYVSWVTDENELPVTPSVFSLILRQRWAIVQYQGERTAAGVQYRAEV